MKGGVTLRELESKCGVSSTTIHRWVKAFEAQKGPPKRADGSFMGKKAWQSLVVRETEMSSEVRELRKELEEARLYNKLLNTMIDIAEDQMGIDIRKKRGAK